MGGIRINMRTISIVTTTYNQLDSFKKLYQSLLKQKKYIHEFIVCDDGSTDGSLEFAQSITDLPVKVFTQEQKGMRLAKNINRGLKIATGDIVFVVFADSYLFENTLSELSNSYIEGTVGCGMRYNKYPDGSLHSIDWRIKDDNDQILNVSQYAHSWTALCGNSMITTPEALRKANYWDEEYVGYGREDYDIFMCMFMNGYLLYMYNNVKVNHVWHEERQDSKNNIERYTDKLLGNGYNSAATQVVLDFDDFSLENNQIPYLEKLKEQFPKIKISLFTIPFDYRYFNNMRDFERDQIKQWIRSNLDWIEIIPHGLTHKDREFEQATYKGLPLVFETIERVFSDYNIPFVKGFKAPQWLYNKDLIRYLDEKGWFLATDRNQPEAPKAKRNYVYTHSVDEPFWLSNQKSIKLHGHISLPSSNNLADNILNLLKINPDACFKFVSEVV